MLRKGLVYLFYRIRLHETYGSIALLLSFKPCRIFLLTHRTRKPVTTCKNIGLLTISVTVESTWLILGGEGKDSTKHARERNH